MSDLSTEQAVGVVAGGVIGFFIGGPAGAARGAYWGYGIGSAFTTTELDAAEGPRMDDRKIQTSRYGEFLPRVYNTERLTGNIFWVEGDKISETSNTKTVEQGGKGGSEQKVTTFAYHVTMAVGICEGPISGISRIWADNILIYDVSDSTDIGAVARSLEIGGDIVIYLGNDDQLPNSTIELEKGTGNVPAFRGTAYLLLRNFQLENYGNRIPNLSFEVLDAHTDNYTPTDITHFLPSDIDNTDLPGFPSGDITKTDFQILPWYYHSGKMEYIRSSSVISPFNSGISGKFRNLTAPVDTSLFVDLINMPYNYSLTKDMSDFSINRSVSRFDSFPWDLPGEIDEYRDLQIRPVDNGKGMFIASWTDNEFDEDVGFTNTKRMAVGLKLSKSKVRYYRFAREVTDISAIQDNIVAAFRDGDLYISASSATDMFSGGTGDLYAFNVAGLGFGLEDGYYTGFLRESYRDGLLYPSRSISLSTSVINIDISWGLDTFGSSLYVLDKTNNLLYSYNRGLGQIGSPIDISALMVGYADLGKRFAIRDNVIHLSQFNTGTARQVMRVWIVDGNDVTQDAEIDLGGNGAFSFHQSIIDIHKELFMYANNAPIGVTGGARASGIIQTVPAFTVFPKFTVPKIVGLEMDRIDLISTADYDTSGLTSDVVDGYMITNPSPVSAILKPLQQAFRFDVYEEDYKIKFVSRGTTSSIEALTQADIRAHEKGSAAPPQAVRVMKNPNDIPGRIELIYKSSQRDYEEGFSYADRLTVDRNAITKLQIPVVMDADKAYKTADILLLDIEREGKGTYEIIAPFKFSHLERTQIITLTTDFDTALNLRIINIEKGAPGLVKIKAVEEISADYTSNAVGDPGIFTQSFTTSAVPSQFIFLDIPMLNDGHNDPGVYWGIVPGGEDGDWKGTTLHTSLDFGATWIVHATATSALKFGIAIDMLDDNDIDTMFSFNQTLDIIMENGILETRTEEQVRNNSNLLAYGRPGNWEIMKFLNSTLIDDDTFRISGLLRGQKGTQYTMGLHQEGDQVVVLAADSVYRMSMLPTNYFHRWRLYLPITIGMNFDEVFKMADQSRGIAVSPNAPNHIKSYRNAVGDITITWRPSLRFNDEWVEGYSPLPDDSDVFEVQIMWPDQHVFKRRILSVPGTHSVVYTAAQQIEDTFFTLPSVDVRIYAFGDTSLVRPGSNNNGEFAFGVV